MEKTGKFLYWSPRFLSILFIIFLSLFSLDVYKPGMSFSEIATGMFMHNIPTLVMIVVLIIAWKNDAFGAVSFFAAGLLYIGMIVSNIVNGGLPWYITISWGFTIAGPAFLIGILFLMSWRRNRKTT